MGNGKQKRKAKGTGNYKKQLSRWLKDILKKYIL
jgi:hypothetical protein